MHPTLKAAIGSILISISGISVVGAQEICPKQYSSYQEVLACAESRAPEVQRASAELETANFSVDVAKTWRNPEFSADSLHGRSAGQISSETELSLGIPVELGGKIRARTDAAKGAVNRANRLLEDAKLRARLDTLLRLHRVRQLVHEVDLLNESIGTFDKLVKQYSSRPRLSPEQETSAVVFRLARSENEIKLTSLREEYASLDSYFKLAVGTGIEALKAVLPSPPKSWPQLQTAKGEVASAASPKLRIAEADLEIANARLSQSKADAWPSLAVGPSIRFVQNGSERDQMLGLNIRFDLPVFNLNGPAKAVALAEVRSAERNKKLVADEQSRFLEELTRTYQISTQSLTESLSHEEIEKRHSQTERLFMRGVVPSSLVIEAHRTVIELETIRNQRELRALEALSTILAFEGKSMETQP